VGNWSEAELGHLRMILERRQSHSVHEMARLAAEKIKKRSVNAIMHKLRELISEKEFEYDAVEINGTEYPARVVSGYVVITLEDGSKKPLHKFIWELENGPLPEGYHIHHISGDRLDNRLENLAVMDAGEHIHLHLANGARPPETFALFCFLQKHNLWEDYLEYRDNILEDFPRPQ